MVGKTVWEVQDRYGEFDWISSDKLMQEAGYGMGAYYLKKNSIDLFGDVIYDGTRLTIIFNEDYVVTRVKVESNRGYS